MSAGRSERARSELIDAAVFYGLAVAFACVAAVLIRRTGQPALAAAYMYTPLLAVATAALIRDRRAVTLAGLGLTRAGLGGWAFALLVPLAVVAAVAVAVAASGVATFRPPAEAGPVAAWPLKFAAHLAVGVVLAFGEETGWRGYLLPRLLPLGVWPAMLLVGFLHGAWHLPLILLTPFYHGEGARWLILPEFLAALTLAGVAYGYLRLKTGSVWPAILMHAALNEYLALMEDATQTDDPARLAALGGESGLFMLVAIAAVALWVARRGGLASRAAPAGPAGGATA